MPTTQQIEARRGDGQKIDRMDTAVRLGENELAAAANAADARFAARADSRLSYSAAVTSAPNAAMSRTARSASTLRFRVIPRVLSEAMKVE